MDYYIVLSVLWLGILTSISPCPLAANISAISFIGRFVGNDRHVLISGLLYIVGRTVVYILIGALITGGVLASSQLSLFLQKYLNEILGPVLILLGMILLGMIGNAFSLNIGASDKLQNKIQKKGILFSFPLGVALALSFCPVSAGLFFGALIPLAVKANSYFVIPTVYGVGTALPVIFFAFIIAFGSELLGKAFHCLTRIELWFRYTAGIIFIIVGIYYTIIYIYWL
ncbi:MAG: aromatic aminobenezylarsenical efflux permease ArsG family transporter [Victivallales bacterium]|nr:aromatic aminobenezylarsenical efflux permease ArsG family transporter [Victivallales bacterium]